MKISTNVRQYRSLKIIMTHRIDCTREKHKIEINDPFAYEDKRVVGYKGLQSQTERALFGTNALVNINAFVSDETGSLI